MSKLLLRILREETPKYFLFVRDGHQPNFRHKLYDLYKANREATPEDLVKQLDPICAMVRALGLRDEETKGFEADDCIATLAKKYAQDLPVVIISGDKDLKQCLGPNVYIWNLAAKEEKVITAASFMEETGVEPSVWPDVQALVGDSVDNIPGVPKIGIKTALQIFSYCKSLDELHDHVDRIPANLQKKLAGHLEEMMLWRQLTRLSTEYPLLTLDDMSVGKIDIESCRQISKTYELVSLRRELEYVYSLKDPLPQTVASNANQGSLLDLDTGPDLPMPCSVPTLKIKEKSALPDCTESVVTLIGEVSQLRFCVQHKDALADQVALRSLNIAEFTWEGSVTDFTTWLGQAFYVVVADLKYFLKAGSSWYDLFCGKLAAKVFDLSLACYLLQPEETDFSWHKLEKYWTLPFQDGKKGSARLALDLYASLLPRLAEAELGPLYHNLELPLVRVLADMELKGLTIDASSFKAFLQEVTSDLESLTSQVYALAGHTFNIRSSQQLGNILYNVLKLKGISKTKSGQISTNQQTLEKLAGQHPVIDAVLKYR
ncbi:MAG: DNA polymerase I, partial [Desulfovibrionaceae bacterium]|nr:DNA polymerase I [Desulfovibrionaceae bacterium]